VYSYTAIQNLLYRIHPLHRNTDTDSILYMRPPRKHSHNGIKRDNKYTAKFEPFFTQVIYI